MVDFGKVKAKLKRRAYSYDQLLDLAYGYAVDLEYCQEQLIKHIKMKDEIDRLQTRYEELMELQRVMEVNNSMVTGFIGGVDTQKHLFSGGGGRKASERFDPLKALAIKLVTVKSPPYKSRRNAAIKIKGEIIAAGKALSEPVRISEDQAEDTITKWLKEAGLLPPKPRVKK